MRWGTRSGFTLIEMLVVISLMGLLAVGILALTDFGNQAAGAKQAAIMAQAVFSQARSEAIKSGSYAMVVVDAYQDSTNPGNYLHRMMVVDYNTSSTSVNPTAVQVSEWYSMPTSVFYYPTYSDGNSTNLTIQSSSGSTGIQVFPSAQSGAGSGAVYVYTFNASGQVCGAPQPPTYNTFLSQPTQLVVAVGHQNAPAGLPVFIDNTRFGFVVHFLGRTSFFQNVTNIPAPSTH